MSFTFKHPKYYTELRKLRNKSDQTISLTLADGCNGSVRSGPGLKLRHGGLTPEASGVKPQATSAKPQAPSSDKKE
jgi:hypothetical protein